MEIDVIVEKAIKPLAQRLEDHACMRDDLLGPLPEPLTDDAQVLVSIYGRLQTLQMTWERAREMYVRHFGIDAVQDCRDDLAAGRQWKGYTDPDRRTWLAVVRAA